MNSCVDGIFGQIHETETKLQIYNNPEVITFNLNWDGEPLPTEILRLMISLPQTF
jgi:hypothetical protein